MRRTFKFVILSFAAMIAISCGNGSNNNTLGSNDAVTTEAKYVFYFIGDGMTATQVRLSEGALTSEQFRKNYAELTGIEDQREDLFLKSLSVTGLATSNAANRYITDSAAAGTALATGSKTNVGVISLDVDNNVLETVAEKAKKKGMKVGIVTSVSMDHATPASFYAHAISRNHYAEISDQQLESGFDYYGGGSAKFSSRAKAEKTDIATATQEYNKKAEANGYKLVATKAEFDNVSKDDKCSVIATIDKLGNEYYDKDGFSLPYTIDLDEESKEDNKISLAQFTQKGIDLLENKDGFFMMVEGGKIDWACHANDAATCAYETVAFDEAVGVAMKFAEKHPKETLIVVTGDHDCGGLTIGFSGTKYESAFDILAQSKSSHDQFAKESSKKIAEGESFEKLLKFACEEFGFTNDVTGDNGSKISMTAELSDYEVKILKDAYTKSVNKTVDQADKYLNTFDSYDPFTTQCTSIVNNKAGIEFSSHSHTAVPVMVFAGGANAHIFNGYYDNTDIPKKIMLAAGL